MDKGEQIRFVVHRVDDGRPLAGKIRSAWDRILPDAGLGDGRRPAYAAPHGSDLADAGGVHMWDAAGRFGMTVEQLEANDGHRYPQFQEAAGEAFGGRR